MKVEVNKAAQVLKEVLIDLMVKFDTKEDRDNFILDIVDGFKDKITINDKLITAEWLCDRYPSLSIGEAGDLKSFCNSRTIRYKGCYGDHMYSLWMETKE